MLKESNVRKGFFEHGEYLALRHELPDYLKPVLTFGYYTGAREGEILGLRWHQVDLRARTANLEPGTTARPSRNAKFQIQNSRPWLPEKFARKAANYGLVLRRTISLERFRLLASYSKP
jgi:integrase